MTGSFCSIYKRNSAEFSIEFSVFKILRFHGLQVFVFQIDLNISMSYKFLEGVSENRYTPKGKRRATFVMCSISRSRCDINNDIGRDFNHFENKVNEINLNCNVTDHQYQAYGYATGHGLF